MSSRTKHWWRAYNDARHDPKLQRLSPEMFRHWFNLMCVASDCDGTFPPIEDIAFELRVKPDKARKIAETLISARLLDNDETGLRPHNWDGRQYQSDVSTSRVKRFRERKRNVSVTAPDTETDTLPKGKGADAPPIDPKTEFFRRSREVLGPKVGGSLAAKLLRSIGNEDDPKVIAKARARIEEASTKANAVEWLGRVMQPKTEQFPLMSGMEGVI